MPRDEPLGQDLPAGKAGLISPQNGIPAPRTQHLRHHADAPRRQPKSLSELRTGCEFIEIYDRRFQFPGRMAARSAR
jgi:hypothetical protein